MVESVVLVLQTVIAAAVVLGDLLGGVAAALTILNYLHLRRVHERLEKLEHEINGKEP